MEAPIRTSVFEIFKIGVGPSSSHTMGPMVAAHHVRVAAGEAAVGVRLRATLRGSLGATGKGHATDRAVIAGLGGLLPRAAAGCALEEVVQRVRAERVVTLGARTVAFDPAKDLILDAGVAGLPHPNTLDFDLLDAAGAVVFTKRYLSVGGGFVEWIDADGTRHPVAADGVAPVTGQPHHPFRNTLELLRIAKKKRLTWTRIALENEVALTGVDVAAVHAGLDLVWDTMRACIRRGLEADPEAKLPGPLNVRRRAMRAYEAAQGRGDKRIPLTDPVELLAHAYALAVNEENAAGHQVVTAPTNGAAGVIPACFAAVQDRRALTADDLRRGLLTAGVIGSIIKRTASLSGAEMGCQGEVGSACAMAAGGLVEMLGGTVDQVEMAAEIGIEHHLGMTCDPIAGLVQIPCIERNVMGAVKALNAATLALTSDGKHRIPFDEALSAMRQIGLDMNAKYKETALGGLATVRSAPHHVEC